MMRGKKWCKDDGARAVELFVVVLCWCCLCETAFAGVGFVEVVGGGVKGGGVGS